MDQFPEALTLKDDEQEQRICLRADGLPQLSLPPFSRQPLLSDRRRARHIDRDVVGLRTDIGPVGRMRDPIELLPCALSAREPIGPAPENRGEPADGRALDRAGAVGIDVANL